MSTRTTTATASDAKTGDSTASAASSGSSAASSGNSAASSGNSMVKVERAGGLIFDVFPFDALESTGGFFDGTTEPMETGQWVFVDITINRDTRIGEHRLVVARFHANMLSAARPSGEAGSPSVWMISK